MNLELKEEYQTNLNSLVGKRSSYLQLQSTLNTIIQAIRDDYDVFQSKYDQLLLNIAGSEDDCEGVIVELLNNKLLTVKDEYRQISQYYLESIEAIEADLRVIRSQIANLGTEIIQLNNYLEAV